jgi:hypothetical protein
VNPVARTQLSYQMRPQALDSCLWLISRDILRAKLRRNLLIMCVADWGRSMNRAPKREFATLVCVIRTHALPQGVFATASSRRKAVEVEHDGGYFEDERATTCARR